MEDNNIYLNCKIETSNRLTKIETILENQNKILDSIHEQTQKTNGRVSKLELWRANITGKQTGIAVVVSLLITVIGFIISNIVG